MRFALFTMLCILHIKAFAIEPYIAISSPNTASNCNIIPVKVKIINSNMTNAISLNTTVNDGQWSVLSGYGKIIKTGHGRANYFFDRNDGASVTFGLLLEKYTGTVDIEVHDLDDPGINDKDENNPIQIHKPKYIYEYENQTISTSLESITKISSEVLNLSMMKINEEHPGCIVDDKFNDNLTIEIGTKYINPISGWDKIVSSNLKKSRNLQFINGRADISLKYNDVGLIRLKIFDSENLIDGPLINYIPGKIELSIKKEKYISGEIVELVSSFKNLNNDILKNIGNENDLNKFEITVQDSEGNNIDFKIIERYQKKAPGKFVSKIKLHSIGEYYIQFGFLDRKYKGKYVVLPSEKNKVKIVPSYYTYEILNNPAVASCVSGRFTHAGKTITLANPVKLNMYAYDKNNKIIKNYNVNYFNSVLDVSEFKLYSQNSNFVTSETKLLSAKNIDGGVQVKFSKPYFLFKKNNNKPYNAEIKQKLIFKDVDSVIVKDRSNDDLSFVGGKKIVSGRLAIKNTHGSKNIPLNVKVESQMFDGKNYIKNENDLCTKIKEVKNFSARNYNKNEISMSILDNVNYAGEIKVEQKKKIKSKYKLSFNLDNKDDDYSYLASGDSANKEIFGYVYFDD